MITLVRAVRASMACPAQWDADGRCYHLWDRRGGIDLDKGF
jgi:hypothetical protein